jgi:hypothetical protein
VGIGAWATSCNTPSRQGIFTLSVAYQAGSS